MSIFAGIGLVQAIAILKSIPAHSFKERKLQSAVLIVGLLITATIFLAERDYKKPDWHLWMTLGDIYYKMNKLDYALESYTRSSELKKNSWMPVFGVAKVYFDRGEKEIAVDLYKKAFGNINDDFQLLILRDGELDPIRQYIAGRQQAEG
jgi:tetratricopeptide (TPR) repeat protein